MNEVGEKEIKTKCFLWYYNGYTFEWSTTPFAIIVTLWNLTSILGETRNPPRVSLTELPKIVLLTFRQFVSTCSIQKYQILSTLRPEDDDKEIYFGMEEQDDLKLSRQVIRECGK